MSAYKKVIGVIGLGNMGSGMALNLLKSGAFAQVQVYDVSAKNVAAVEGSGAVPKPSVAELASDCDVIVTMLPSCPIVSAVCKGEGKVKSLN